MTVTEVPRIAWVRESKEYYYSPDRRFDIYYSHGERAWVAYDTQRPKKSPFDCLAICQEWCERRASE